jgi:hypothetical protein
MVLIAIGVGCRQPDAAPTSTEAPTTASFGVDQKTAGDELGHVRAATARFHDIDVARNAGYTLPLTGCMVDPAGGMGFHFGKPSALEKLTPDPLEPEALLYEPQANGRYRLVGLEYIIPYTILPRESAAPTLFGQSFKHNDTFQVWALHAWIWRNNPDGIFKDWNPTVNCDAAPAAARVSHSSH